MERDRSGANRSGKLIAIGVVVTVLAVTWTWVWGMFAALYTPICNVPAPAPQCAFNKAMWIAGLVSIAAGVLTACLGVIRIVQARFR